jgi:hypothetical protein
VHLPLLLLLCLQGIKEHPWYTGELPPFLQQALDDLHLEQVSQHDVITGFKNVIDSCTLVVPVVLFKCSWCCVHAVLLACLLLRGAGQLCAVCCMLAALPHYVNACAVCCMLAALPHYVNACNQGTACY